MPGKNVTVNLDDPSIDAPTPSTGTGCAPGCVFFLSTWAVVKDAILRYQNRDLQSIVKNFFTIVSYTEVS